MAAVDHAYSGVYSGVYSCVYSSFTVVYTPHMAPCLQCLQCLQPPITSPPGPHAWQLRHHMLLNMAICTCTQYGPSHTQHNTHKDIMAAPLSLWHAWHTQNPCSTSHHHLAPRHGSYGTTCCLIWQHAHAPDMGPLAHRMTHTDT